VVSNGIRLTPNFVKNGHWFKRWKGKLHTVTQAYTKNKTMSWEYFNPLRKELGQYSLCDCHLYGYEYIQYFKGGDFITKLTNFMGQFLLEKLIVTQIVKKIPRFSLNPKVQYRVHKSLPSVFVLSRTNPVRTFPPYYPKIHSNIVPSMPRSSKWFFPSGFGRLHEIFKHR
jgi:hypothetical protein